MITEVPFLNARIIGQKYLNVSDIKIGWMPRGIDWDYVEQLAEVLRNGNQFPEDIEVFQNNELADGLHRMEGYKKVETITIPVSVWNCPKENRTALKIYLNSLHGKQLSTKEKQESYVSLLEENPSIKDNSAALILGVSERTIRRWKPESLKQKRLSQEEVKKIYELKEEGKSSREIANEIGVSHTAINKLETSDTCPKLPDSPEPSNVIPSPVQFQKQESVDDYDDEDEEDLEEIDDNTVYQVVKKDPEKELKALGLKLQDSLDFLMHWGKHIQPVLDNPIALNGVSPDVIGEMVLLANQNLNRLKEFFPTITKAERR